MQAPKPQVPQIKRLTTLTPESIDPPAALLAESFSVSDDALSAALYGSTPNGEAYNALRLKARLYEAARDGEVWTVEAAGLVVAVAVVWPPKSRGKKEATPYDDELAKLATAEVVEAEKSFYSALADLEDNDDMYYLSFLATATWARGRGLAGFLMRHVLDKAHAEGCLMAVTTTTEGNLPMYEKMGFKVVDTASVTVRGHKIDMWAMDNAESEGHL